MKHQQDIRRVDDSHAFEAGNDGNGHIGEGYKVDKEELERDTADLEIDPDDEEPMPENLSIHNFV